MSSGSENGARGILEAATDLVRAVIRGSAKGWGMALKELGQELENFGDEVTKKAEPQGTPSPAAAPKRTP